MSTSRDSDGGRKVRLCFNIDLPSRDLAVGRANPFERSLLGFEGREKRRLFPIVISLEMLTQIDEWQIERFENGGKPLPLLYDTGVFYKSQPPGVEEWMDVVSLYRDGHGDCKSLASARCAELRHMGIAATPAITFKRRGNMTLVHCLVLWPDGYVEDPSRILGMKGEFS